MCMLLLELFLRQMVFLLIAYLLAYLCCLHHKEQKFLEVPPEGVLPIVLHQVGVEGAVPVEVAADRVDQRPAVGRIGLLQQGDDLGIKDPLGQGVLVLEMVVEGLAADPAGVADVADPHLVEGLLLQPYWTPGIVNPTSRGAVIGFADYHTHLHFYRAIIEGIAFELYHSLDIMQKRAKRRVDEVFVGGGGARSDIVCQITADVFGIPVKRIQTHEACSVGAAMVAFLALGVFRDYDEAIAHMVHVADVFKPRKTEHETYMDLYSGAYCKVFRRLEPVYRRIIKITKRRDIE